MKRKKQFTYKTLAVAGVVSLLAVSAFAESRPQNETRSDEGRRTNIVREGATMRGESRGSSRSGEGRAQREGIDRRNSGRGEQPSYTREDRDVTRGREQREGVRNRDERGGSIDPETTRGYDRTGRGNDDRDRNGDWRNNRGDNRNSRGDNRNYGSNRNDRYDRNRGYSGSRDSYRNRTPYYHSGRISRTQRYGNGYRVWIVGSPFPFFVPSLYWSDHRFRVGLSIRLGGYYNPLGYYDYYDPYYYDTYDRYDRYDRYESRGVIRGTVESIDRGRRTFVVRNRATGNFVTIVDRDSRENVRPGDYVEITGDWTRNGLFTAYDIDVLDNRYDRYDD